MILDIMKHNIYNFFLLLITVCFHSQASAVYFDFEEELIDQLSMLLSEPNCTTIPLAPYSDNLIYVKPVSILSNSILYDSHDIRPTQSGIISTILLKNHRERLKKLLDDRSTLKSSYFQLDEYFCAEFTSTRNNDCICITFEKNDFGPTHSLLETYKIFLKQGNNDQTYTCPFTNIVFQIHSPFYPDLHADQKYNLSVGNAAHGDSAYYYTIFNDEDLCVACFSISSDTKDVLR